MRSPSRPTGWRHYVQRAEAAVSWTKVVGIDAPAELVHALHHAGDARQVAAFRRLEESLRLAGGTDLATRLGAVRYQAPQVLASPYAGQWMVATLRAVRATDAGAIAPCVVAWTRFEAAAAVLSGAEWSGSLAPADGRGCVVLPAADLVLSTDGGTEISVSGGRVSVGASALPACRGLRLDMHDDLLRLPALAKFDFPDCASDQQRSGELAEALAAGEHVCPGFADRFITTVVPVDSPPGWARAGTDESARLVTYCSFGRTPTDLLAALSHEEAHAVINTCVAVTGEDLPQGEGTMPVPWREGHRPLPAVLHGLAAFGRAATIRARCGRAGLTRPVDDEMGAVERGWVEEVSAQVAGGQLGPLPPAVAEWVEANLAALDSPTPAPPPGPAPELVAVSTPGFGFSWWMLESGLQAAASAYPVLRTGPWLRRTSDFYAQDVRDLGGRWDGFPLGSRLFEEFVPSFLREAANADVRLAKVEAHRLRPGDRIDPHTDAAQEQFAFRAVLNVTPADLEGGSLRLWSRGRASVAAALAPGSMLVFEIGERSFHEVTPNSDGRDRLTVVASFSRA